MNPSLLDTIARHAQQRSDMVALRFLNNDKVEEIDYATLWQRVQAGGSHLLRQDLHGERAIVACPSGIDYVLAVLACMYAGVIAVPYHPVRPRQRARFEKVAAAASAAALIAGASEEPAWQGIKIDKDTFTASGGAILPPEVGDIAYLQYTSGSTGLPKGAIITNANVLANVDMIRDAFAVGDNDSWLGWLPLYHDMGLVSMILHPLSAGVCSTFMAPMAFMQDPLLWLKAMSTYRATISGCPNFGYEACVRAAAQQGVPALDLAHWRVAINGAESVDPATLDQFSAAFHDAGFAPHAFKPCYGLAEATLLVSAVRHDQAVQRTKGADGRMRVGVGAPAFPATLRLRDPDTGALIGTDGKTGEVLAGGPSLARAYWEDPAASAAAFLDLPEGRFLCTGDLGYFDKGQLVICGRKKEVLVVRGRNLYPQDIEQAAATTTAPLERFAAAAFACDSQLGEQTVLLMEVHRHATAAQCDGLIAAVNQELSAGLDFVPDQIALVRQGTLARTTSGKVQRLACRDAFRGSTLELLHHWQRRRGMDPAAPGTLEGLIEACLGRTLQERDWQASLIELGLDSLALATLNARAIEVLGAGIPIQALYEGRPIVDLLRHRSAAVAPATALPAGPACLSEGQRAMCLIQQTHPESTRFTLVRAVALEPVYDKAAFVAAIDHMLGSLDAARARLPLDTTAEAVFASCPAPVVQQYMPADDVDCDNWLAAFGAAPWLPRGAPLMAIAVLWQAGRTVVAIRAHHIVCDLGGIELLFRHIAELAAGRQSALQGGAFGVAARREQARAASAGLAARQAFGTVLQAPLGVLDLPGHSSGTPAKEGGQLRVSALPDAVHAGLPSLCQRYGLTEYVALASIFALALAQMTGKRDIVAGTPADTRLTASDAGAIDNFANLTPWRVRIDENATLAALLEELRSQMAALSEHRDYPFTSLVESLQPVRRAGRTPMIDAVFASHRRAGPAQAALLFGSAGQAMQVGGIVMYPLACRAPDAPFDLRLDVVLCPEGALVGVEYRPAVVNAEWIETLLAHFGRIALVMVGNPQAPVRTVLSRPSPVCGPVVAAPWDDLAARIGNMCARHPDAIAVRDHATQATYASLWQRSGTIAAWLVEQGRAGKPVAACLPRSVDMLAALLGIWRAGGFYVPIAPNQPASRVDELVRLSGADLLLSAEVVSAIPLMAAAPTLAPHRLAYRIFTSGTTGTPKCVDVTRQGLSNVLHALQRELDLQPGEVCAATTGLGFDIATVELWLPLLCGATVLIVQAEQALDGQQVNALTDAHKVTVIQGTPSWYGHLLKTGWHGSAQLRLLCGGERLDWALARELLQRSKQAWNVYGPTEATVWSSAMMLRDEPSAKGTVPIGYPLDNTTMLVLDDRLQCAALGVEGDLYIGGAGLADGYHDAPDLTAERFVQWEGVRLYRTGDRALLDHDGMFHFRGRLDRQVKVAGHRIELAEVESYLQRLPHVMETVAFVDTTGDTEVWAALTCVPGSDRMDELALRRALREIAPAHAIPARLQQFDVLPLNQNGKACTEQLRAAMRRQTAPLIPAPHANALEGQIAACWAEVLRRPVVERDVTFFDYGGKSLDLPRVRELIGQRCGQVPDLLTLLAASGVADLARRLQGAAPPELAPVPLDRMQASIARRRAALKEKAL